MATQSTFYLDAPSFGSATVIYSDAALTTIAADGFYSDGTVVREQVSGVLLPQTNCPSCATPCGGTISASGQQGIYYLDSDLGTDVGAVVIRFDPYSVPDGILAAFNGQLYNQVVSPIYGSLKGDAGLPTYIGATSANCGVPVGSPYTLQEFEYTNGTFADMGTTTVVPILSGQLQFTVGGPGNTFMVIPKTQAAPSVLSLQFIGPCAGTAFDLSVSCPTALSSIQASSMSASSALACADAVDQTYYYVHVNGASGTLGLYDFIFTDPNGEFKAAAGYYKTSAAGANNWFRVDSNGIIAEFGVCSAPASYPINPVGVSSVSAADACTNEQSSPATLYADNPSLNVGVKVYYDAAMTQPIVETFLKYTSNWDLDGLGMIVNTSSVQC